MSFLRKMKKINWAKQEIALAFQAGVPLFERVAQGIRSYASAHTSWRFLISPETHHLEPTALNGWSGAGVIAVCNTPQDIKVLSSLECPVVNISGMFAELPFPSVINDYIEVGRIGARHLMERGYRRLAYYGVQGAWYSDQIEAGFQAEVQQSRGKIEVLRGRNSSMGFSGWQMDGEKLDRWLMSLKVPIGLMATHDPRAAMVLRSCERLGLRVPADVGVLGMNDDTSTCESCTPTLSSVDRRSCDLGWEAARTLDEMIEGGSPPHVQVVPVGMVRERASTDITVVEHQSLRESISFLEANFRQPISIDQIAQAGGKSRRWLENAFRSELGLSPATFLRKVRTRAAIRLLEKKPFISSGKLASACGFSGTRQLNAAFLMQKGVPVRALRKSAK